MTNPITPLTPEQEAIEEAKTAKEGFVHRGLVALDQFVNVLTGGLPDETISSRASRASLQGKWWGIAMSAFLNLFQKDHGAKAQAGDIERAEHVEETEKEH